MRSGESGYAFLAVLVLLVLVAVLLMVGFQPYTTVMQREREAELVFRGEAYVEAIRAYQGEHGGAYPTKLSDLLKPGPRRRRYIRQLYRNPFDPEGKWSLLAPGVTPPKQGVGGLSSPGSLTPPPPPTPPRPGQLPGANQPLPFRLDGQEGQPIVGVYAKINKQSFREYRGKNSYDEWYFSPLVIPVPGKPGGMPGQPGRPGQPGQPAPPGGIGTKS